MWFGILLYRRHGGGLQICFEKDRRGKLELPKGGEEHFDKSPFATARREMHEEAGIWVGYRKVGEYFWTANHGSAFLVTEMQPGDIVYASDTREWRRISELEGVREDHRRLVERLFLHRTRLQFR